MQLLAASSSSKYYIAGGIVTLLVHFLLPSADLVNDLVEWVSWEAEYLGFELRSW